MCPSSLLKDLNIVLHYRPRSADSMIVHFAHIIHANCQKQAFLRFKNPLNHSTLHEKTKQWKLMKAKTKSFKAHSKTKHCLIRLRKHIREGIPISFMYLVVLTTPSVCLCPERCFFPSVSYAILIVLI